MSFSQSIQYITSCALLAFAITIAHAQSGAETVRHADNLDTGWRFHLGAAHDAIVPAYDDSSWRRVDVPHDYVVEGTFSKINPAPSEYIRDDWYWLHAYLPLRPAVYRKTISIPANAKGKRLWLEFDGVFSNSRYWLNGREHGQQYSGYRRSRLDVTEAANYGGRNVIAVEIDPRYDGWWYEGAGIYRHIRLITVDAVHVSPDGIFVAPTVADPGDGLNADATVVVSIDVMNTRSGSVSAEITSEILDGSSKVVGKQTSTYEIGISASAKVKHSIPLAHATLWSPQPPALYHLHSTVRIDERTADEVTTAFGVRHVRFDAERGLFINGKPLKLQGVNMHEDHAGVGVAMPDRLFTRRLERLKEMGCNAIRLSHNPVTPFLLDECDRLGFLVVAENRHLGDTYLDQSTKDIPAVAHRDLSALIERDRNHPSIILWSLCNEQWLQKLPESAAMIQAMRQRVHELDPTRLVTAAMNGGFDSAQGMGSALDVIGINYNPEVYDSVHKLFPRTPMFASEIASEISTRGVYATERWENYYGDRDRGYVSAYSISAGPGGQTVTNAWPPVATRDFVSGGFVWSGFDYKGEPRPFPWPVVSCHYGVMDLCGYPKDSYYYYKAWWSDEPVLHLFPHWNWTGKEGQPIPVWLHSNCEEVELFLNGASLGRKKVERYQPVIWSVNYAPGKLVAKGWRNGVELQVERETVGAPSPSDSVPIEALLRQTASISP